MFAKKLFVALCLFKAVTAQINGEFWWLNEKVKNYHGIDIQPAKYEYLSEFDNDESDKIVFDNIESSSWGNNKKEEGWKDEIDVTFKDSEENFPWSGDMNEKLIQDKVMDNDQEVTNETRPIEEKDQLIFHFPGSKEIWNMSSMENSTTLLNNTNSTLIDDNVHFKPSKEENQYSQNICTYLNENECNRRLGILYKSKARSKNDNAYCCILPLKDNEEMSSIFHFPINRIKRSSVWDKKIVALNQRQALLTRLSSKIPAPVSPEITKKIVTPEDDYEDPYSNIKNSGFKTPNVNKRPTSTYGYTDYQDEEYADEVPKPGLIGIYSDHGQMPHGSSQWSDEAEDESEAIEVGYGFSTLDPRLDTFQRVTSRPPKRNPPKVSSSSSEETRYESGTQSITYNANPNFQVLQGFKLLNLVRNRSRSYKKNSTETSQTDFDYGSPEAVVIDNPTVTSTSDEYDDSEGTEQVYKGCGRTNIDIFQQDKQSGEAPYGSSPWLILVMRYRRPRRILCHATLVHPRAAVTSADCVYGSKAGEITIYAGVWLWSFGDGDKTSQQRLATVHLHPKYNPSDITNGLALLHWNRPLRLSPYVQPVCLGDPHVGDSCAFVGWGGHAQTIHSRPRYQKARITTPRECNSCHTKNREAKITKDTFCAAVETSGCVTGVGGALICSVSDKPVAVGVVVSRDSCDVTSPHVLVPAQDWIRRALSALGII